MVAVVLVIVFSPFNRFFNPAPKDLGPMSIGGPIMEEPLTAADVRNKPCLGVLVKIDQLYFLEEKLSEAIAVAESGLGKIPEKTAKTGKKYITFM